MRHQTGEHEVLRVGIQRRRRTSRPRQSRGHPANERTAKRRTTSGISGHSHMSPFIPNLSQQTATLRDLVKKDAEFIWAESHNAAFEATKSLIGREVTLAYFDPQAESVIQVDASSRGLGAVLIQHGKPVIANSDTPTLNVRCSQSSSVARGSTCMSTENRSLSSRTTNLSR